MKEFFKSSLFWLLPLILFLMALYREWENDNNLGKEIRKIFCNKKFKGKKVSIRQPDIFLYYILQRSLNYLFRGIVLRHILNYYLVFPLTIIFSLFLYYRYEVDDQSLILFITFMSILWYSKETFDSRQEQKNANRIAKKANEIAIGRPVLSIIKNYGDTIELRNDGTNIAYNIWIKFYYKERENIKNDKIKFPILGRGLFYRIDINNGAFNILLSENSKKLIDLIDGEKKNENDQLIPDENLGVIIEYSDSSSKEGRQYFDYWKVDKDILLSHNEGRFRLEKMNIVNK
ncbi:MAG: hypothetical protein Q7U36_00555 [bacterium]|nr:hypothetical protein [bacterium]